MLLVKIPLINALGRTKGCEKAPDKIIGELKEIFSNEGHEKPVFSVKEIEVNNSNLEESNLKIQEKAEDLFIESKERIIFIGGDHSLSFNTVKAFNSVFDDSCLVIFDAHADCMKPMQEPTHEEWLRALVEQGFNPENIMLVALRNIEPEENEFLIKNRVKIFSMKELNENIEESCDKIMEFARKFESFYLSLDIDSIDPAFAPATGYIEPGGLTSRQFIYLIQRLNMLDNLRAIDLVEVNPEKDLNGLTLKLAAKIIGEFC